MCKDLYIEGLTKILKPLVNNFPKFRHILSAINKAANYVWAKFFVPLLRSSDINDHTIDDSFDFANDIIQQNPGLFMALQDIDSLLTNSP